MIFPISPRTLNKLTTLAFMSIIATSSFAAINDAKLKYAGEFGSKLSTGTKINDGSIANSIPLFNGEIAITGNRFATAEKAFSDRVVMRGASDTALYTKASPAVVLIVTDDGMGSGSVINKQGDILTNWHVVGNQSEVGVFFKPDSFEERNPDNQFIADVIKIDQVSDLAIIRLRHMPEKYGALEFANKNEIAVAMDVHAIGHPHGQVWSYTKGLVSQVRANYEWRTSTNGIPEVHNGDIIQTQTPINPGNSGGPLLNDSGKIIGVNSFVDSRADGINFAVAITEVNRFMSRQDNRYLNGHSSSDSKSSKRSDSDSGQQIDFDGDGKPDAQGYDSDNNGKLDTYVIDIDNDGEGDVILIDSNENGQPDIEITEEIYQGSPVYIWNIDEDEDGYADLKGIDYDRDGEPDQIIRS